MEPILMMCPLRRLSIPGRHKEVRCAMASTLTASIRRAVSQGISEKYPYQPNPALLMSTSTLFPRQTCSKSAARSSSRLRSAATTCASPPSALISFASACRRSSRRATSTTRSPFPARKRTSAAPMPADAPVMRAVRSSMRKLLERAIYRAHAPSLAAATSARYL